MCRRSCGAYFVYLRYNSNSLIHVRFNENPSYAILSYSRARVIKKGTKIELRYENLLRRFQANVFGAICVKHRYDFQELISRNWLRFSMLFFSNSYRFLYTLLYMRTQRVARTLKFAKMKRTKNQLTSNISCGISSIVFLLSFSAAFALVMFRKRHVV